MDEYQSELDTRKYDKMKYFNIWHTLHLVYLFVYGKLFDYIFYFLKSNSISYPVIRDHTKIYVC